MSAAIGELLLSMGLLAAAGTVLAASLNLKAARWLLAAFTALIVGSSAVLLLAFVRSDFSFVYVADYSERAMPIGYKLAAFWAGREGSLLLWVLALALMSVVAMIQLRKAQPREQAVAIAALAAVNAGFAAVMVFAADANPFKTQAMVADGFGLNPLLQNPSMVAHPPLLFIGYAAFTVPFAMLLAVLAAGRSDNQWIKLVRGWLMFAWLFLSVGILLGAQWAYVELGWGGYWAWDPVENASLLPWLTATAALHSIGIQSARGMFKRWNAALIAGTFLLCILATYITRSGAVQSVHTFGNSLSATLILCLLVIATLAAVAVLVWRWRLLAPENPLERLVSKEGAFLAANVLLVVIMFVTLYGTMHPVFAGLFKDDPGSFGPPFYNSVVVPMSLLLIALMAVGPLLTFGNRAAELLKRGMVVPATIAATALLIAVIAGMRNGWALVCLALTAVTLSNVFGQLLKTAYQRAKIDQVNGLAALVRVIDENHRRYGGQFVHVGMILIVVGIAGSSLFGHKENFQLRPGESAEIAGLTVQFNQLNQLRKANFTAFDADVALVDAAGNSTTLHPQIRYYDKSEQPNTEVALTTNLRRDVYVTLAGWEDNGRLVAIQVIINPLVLWIWIGSIVLTLGAMFCLTPRLIRQSQTQQSKSVSLPIGLGSPCNAVLENKP